MAHVEEFCDEICMIDSGQVVLSGNLREIKRSYPRDRLLISLDAGDGDALRRALENSAAPLIASVDHTPRGALAVLRDEKARGRLLSLLIDSGVGIDSFTVVEPTLEEIFIEKAGEADETV
jgi:ABC-2 type transport system ATP-binding protein